MPASVVVRDLRKSFGPVEAVRGVGFEIRPGEIFGLLGPNGAGKTTTLECLVGLREADGGEITISGVDARRQPREARQRIGVALQATALPDQITPREALTLFGAFYRERVPAAELLARFALTEKAEARFATLSGGQRQRLALALAFVNRPELVLLDEPTAGLDPAARHELRDEIRRIKRDGHTVLLTTHDLEEAGQLCDRLAIIHHGRIIAQGAPGELLPGAEARQSVRLVAARPLDAALLAGLPAVQGLRWAGATAQFFTADAAQTLPALLQLLAGQGNGLVELQVQPPSLEEVFLALTRPDRPGGAA